MFGCVFVCSGVFVSVCLCLGELVCFDVYVCVGVFIMVWMSSCVCVCMCVSDIPP